MEVQTVVKMKYPAGVNTYRDGEWKDPSAHALIEVADEVVAAFEAAGFEVLPANNARVDLVIDDAVMSAGG